MQIKCTAAYSSVADVYDKARPSYPQELINRAVTLAQLSSDAMILEVGCGSGNATVAFAQLGFSMLCLELNVGYRKSHLSVRSRLS